MPAMMDNEAVRQLKFIEYCVLSTNSFIGRSEMAPIVSSLCSHGHAMRPYAMP